MAASESTPLYQDVGVNQELLYHKIPTSFGWDWHFKSCCHLKLSFKDAPRFVQGILTFKVLQMLLVALLGMHAFTGCDTVSAFFGTENPNAMKIVRTKSIVSISLEPGQ